MEQSLEQETVVNEEIVMAQEVSEEEEEYGPPRGTVAFVALMLIGYVIYYAWHYIEIFVLRGA